MYWIVQCFTCFTIAIKCQYVWAVNDLAWSCFAVNQPIKTSDWDPLLKMKISPEMNILNFCSKSLSGFVRTRKTRLRARNKESSFHLTWLKPSAYKSLLEYNFHLLKSFTHTLSYLMLLERQWYFSHIVTAIITWCDGMIFKLP